MNETATVMLARLNARTAVSARGCWEWTGYCDRYGIVRHRGRTRKVHRVAWEIFNGPIPTGMKVLHQCDNPPCWNPAHLFLGTQADNVRDCVAKGRKKGLAGDLNPARQHPERMPRGDRNGMRLHPGLLRGEKNGRSKVTDRQRAEITGLRRSGVRRDEVARRFGLSVSQIGRITRSVAQQSIA